jgi:acyl-homoserine-lactone acylase
VPRLSRRLTHLLLIVLVGTSTAACGKAPRTEILWDTWGIPHVYGKDLPELFHAFGWAQMENHGDLLLRLYGHARGRAAEYWGGSAELDSDRWVRRLGIPDRARDWLVDQDPEFGTWLQAFVNGINQYARMNPDRIADEVEVVLPVEPADVMAHVQRVLYSGFIVSPGVVRQANRRLDQAGSNAWAIAPSRTTSGNAMLLANPHLWWGDFFTLFEAQLSGPGIDAYGATLVGMPVLLMAFNDHLGWTHTVNDQDGADLYELELTEGGYRFDGAVRTFAEREERIRVRQDDGRLREEIVTVLSSVHGPVVAREGERAVALRVVGLEQSGLARQWWEMARASSLTEFEGILTRLEIPTLTIMYADRDGHILHLFGGRTPVRAVGNAGYWAGVVPGDTSATLWTDTHPYEDLPRISDPATGWLQNANDPPWGTTFPMALDPDDYPDYMASRSMSFRAQRSVRLLDDDDQISFEELMRYKHSTRMEMADRVLDELLPLIRLNRDATIRRAATVLDGWDRSANAESRGGVLFSEWARRAGMSRMFARPWDEAAPRTTPGGLARPQEAIRHLKTAAENIEDRYGTMDVPWGEVYRLRVGDHDLPASGASSSLGVFRVLDFQSTNDGKFAANFGDSYVAAIEFSNPIRAWALLGYGNASQSHSPHVGDQLELLSRNRLRPVWRSRRAIEANLESVTVLKPVP